MLRASKKVQNAGLRTASAAMVITAAVGGIARSALAPPSPATPSISLTGVVRDFRDRMAIGGHPDFEAPDILYAPYKYVGNLVEPTLGADGLPVFTGGGGGWSLLPAPTANPLRDVSLADQFRAWAVGDVGTIVRTTDYGNTWTTQVSGTALALNAVQMKPEGWTIIPGNDGWAVGASGMILRTLNGGTTWTQVGAGVTGSNLFDVQFPVDSTTGFAVGGNGTVLKSTDGGATWVAMPAAPTAGGRLNAIWFRTTMVGFAVGQNAVVLKTTDGAMSWTAVPGLPAAVIAANLEIKDIQFPSANIGYASGAGGLLMRSANGGDTWTEVVSGPGEIRALDFPNGDMIGVAVGSGGRLFETANGGAGWAQTSLGGMWFNGLDLAAATVGMAVGSAGSVARLIPTGQVVTEFAFDSSGNPIAPQVFDAALGDIPATLGPATDGSIQSKASFDQWFRDVLGVNSSMAVTIRLSQQADGTFAFDSAVDEPYASLGGFYPIENLLYGNPGIEYKPGALDRNYHFTFHGRWEFAFDDAAGLFFTFRGDDDVFVFINGQQVIDLGGTHMPREQVVDLDRLGLTDGDTYQMDFFFAERHCCGSNMKITTNLPLVSLWQPSINGSAD